MRKKHRERTQKQTAVVKLAVRLDESRLHRSAIALLVLLPLVFYLRFLFGAQMLYGTDWLGAGYIHMREFMADRAFRIALWWPLVLSGQPTAAGFFADIFYLPTMLLRLVLPVYVAWSWTFAIHISVAGLGTYLFLKELGLKVIPATLGGIAYMFAGSLLTLTYAGHDGRLIGSALLPLALFFLHRGLERRQLLQFLLCGLIVALQLLSGHLQKVYYTVLVLFAYFIVMWIRAIRVQRSAGIGLRLVLYFGLGMGLALALSAVQYLPVYGNLPYASRGVARGYEYAASWSMPVIETFDLLTPRFSGGLTGYWGANPFKLHSEYLGILPLLFAAIGIATSWRKRTVKFFALTFGFTLLMAWGGYTPFYRIPYHILPGLGMFRGPGMMFFIAAFSLAILAAFGVQHLLDARTRETNPRLPRAAVIAALIPVTLLFLFVAARGPVISALQPDTPQKATALNANFGNMTVGMLIATVAALIGLGLAFLLLRRRLRPVSFAAIAAAVMVLDIGISLNLWSESTGYIRGVPPPAEYYAADESVTFLKQDTGLYRVLPVNYQRSQDGTLTYHGIQSVAGELPNPLQTYQDFIGAGTSVMFQVGNLVNPNFMDLLNVKYLLAPTLPEDVSRYDESSRRAIRQMRDYFADLRFEPAFTGRQYTVYRNLGFLPRAFFVPAYRVVENQDEVLGLLMREDFEPEHTALLYDDPGFVSGPDSAVGAARVVSFDPNEIRVEVSTTTPGLLVLSENWHPAWKATANGKSVPVLQAYHTLRAVAIGPETREVVFRYDSLYYNAGRLLTLAAALFLLGTIIASVAARRRRQGS